MQEARELTEYRHGRVPRAVRLRQVLTLARGLFAERGYSGASMDELARRAGVSKPVIYDLVGSKEELFKTLVTGLADDLAARVRAAVVSERDARRRLLAGATAWFGFVAEHRALWATFLSPGDAPSAAEIARVRDAQAAVVAELLASDPASAVDVDHAPVIDAVAHLINGAFEALGGWWVAHPDAAPSELAELCTRILFPGLIDLAERPPAAWGAGS